MNEMQIKQLKALVQMYLCHGDEKPFSLGGTQGTHAGGAQTSGETSPVNLQHDNGHANF